jgi:hypothetical protein
MNEIIKTVTASKPPVLPASDEFTPEKVAAMPASIPAAGNSDGSGRAAAAAAARQHSIRRIQWPGSHQHDTGRQQSQVG